MMLYMHIVHRRSASVTQASTQSKTINARDDRKTERHTTRGGIYQLLRLLAVAYHNVPDNMDTEIRLVFETRESTQHDTEHTIHGRSPRACQWPNVRRDL